MSSIDSLPFPPDDELRAFLEEYDATNGRMYQDRTRPATPVAGSTLPPMRPKYYGRKISNSLRLKRTSRLMTQLELAAKVGCTRKAIWRLENGNHEPSVYLALAIAEALDMKVEDVFHLPPLTPVPPSKY